MYNYATAFHAPNGEFVVTRWSYTEAVELAVQFMAIQLLFDVPEVS